MKPVPAIIAHLLLLIVVTEQVYAQYPDEICNWECVVIYCDYYGCDYDCHEVCYPDYRAQGKLFAGKDTAFIKTVNVPSRTGKIVKMKIQNPTIGAVRNGQVFTTSAQAKNFALFQSCLSNRSAQSELTANRDSSSSKPSHIVFGNRDVSVKGRL